MAKDPRVTRIEDLPGPKSKGEMDEMKMPYEEYCKKIFDVGNEHTKPTALKGIRWLSCTMYIFTPHSVANLAELGAECIKIEMSRMGDAMRHTSPFNEAYLYPLHDTRPMTGTGLGFTNANPNKYFLTMDYHIPEMVDIFYGLVKKSDGLTELYRPGTLDKWKMSYRYLSEINPRFIYVWGGGFGYGPKIFGGSYDILGQAHAGLASITGMHEYMGGHCTKHTNWVIDWQSGNMITSLHPGGHPPSPQDRSGHHDRIFPGAGPDPHARTYHHHVRQVRHRPPALGQLGHPTGGARHHPVRQIRFSGCRQSAGQVLCPLCHGQRLPGCRLQGTVRTSPA